MKAIRIEDGVGISVVQVDETNLKLLVEAFQYVITIADRHGVQPGILLPSIKQLDYFLRYYEEDIQ